MSETGVVLEYERQAINGDEMPDGLDYADQIMYQQLRLLYNSVRNGIISRDTAVREKKNFLSEYKKNKIGVQSMQGYIDYINSTCVARTKYTKNRTLENADNLVKALEGRLICLSKE